MASGETLVTWVAQSNEPPAFNPATLDKRNMIPVLDFDDSVNEHAVFRGVMPQHYSGNGIKAYLHVSMTSAVTGDIDLDGAFERIGDGQQDIDSDGFATAKSVDNTAVPATCGHVDIIEMTFSDGAEIDNVGPGELFRFKLSRDAVSDTATGDMELHAIELREA